MSHEQDLITLLTRFRIDVTETTNALIFTLYGINLVHRMEYGHPPNNFPVPDYPVLKAIPQVIGNVSLFDRTGPNGPLEQLAFKGWFTEVYDSLWERTYRNGFESLFQKITPNAIRPEADVMGDLRLIRHDLVHRVTADQCSKCKILRWFRAGDLMQIKLSHILDFLNQMGWVDEAPRLIENRGVMWCLTGNAGEPTSVPRFASVRPLLYSADESEFPNVISVVFEDGIHGLVPMIIPDDQPVTDQEWMSISVDKAGDLLIPPNHRLRAEELYPVCTGPKTKGPGVFSPAFRFARKLVPATNKNGNDN